MASRARGGVGERGQVAMKRDAQRTFRVKERARVEPLSSARSVQRVFGAGAERHSRSQQQLNAYRSDDSDSSAGWERDSLEGGTRPRTTRLAKSVTTANLAGRREARGTGRDLQTSRSSTSIHEAGAERRKPRMKTTDIDRLVDRLSKRSSREPAAGVSRGKRGEATVRAEPARQSPPTEYRRSNTFDLDKDEDEEPVRGGRDKVGAARGHGLDVTVPRDFLRSDTFEKDVESAPAGRRRRESPGGGEAPAMAWPSNDGDDDASSYRVTMRRKTDARTSFEAGTFTRRRKVESTNVSNRWSLHSEEDVLMTGREERDASKSSKNSTKNVPSLFSRARISSRDKDASDFMSSSPDLTSFTSSKDFSPFPSGKKEKADAGDESATSESNFRTSRFSSKARATWSEEGSTERESSTPRADRVDLSEILARASRRRTGRPASAAPAADSPDPPSSAASDQAPAGALQGSYRRLFASTPSSNREKPAEGGREHNAADSLRADGHGRRFRSVFKTRRDSDESDNSGKDTGFSSGRSNSPSRDGGAGQRDTPVGRRGELTDRARPPARLFTKRRSSSPECESAGSPARSRGSSSAAKSGSTTPRRQLSPETAASPVGRASQPAAGAPSSRREVELTAPDASPTRPRRSEIRARQSPASDTADAEPQPVAASARGVRPPRSVAAIRPTPAANGSERAGERGAEWPPPPVDRRRPAAAAGAGRARSQERRSESSEPPEAGLLGADGDTDSLIAVGEYATDSDHYSDHSLEIEFDRMQLHSSQQDDDAPVKDKPLPAAKQQPMAFTAPPESLKRKQVTAAQPAGPPPDVAQPAPAPAPSPELAQEPAQTPAPAPAPAPVASRQLPPADEQGGSPREAALREEIRKRDRDIETLQDAVSKLKQQLAASKTAQQRMSKVVDLHMLSLARLASSRGGEPQQAPDVRRLTSERDEAREEVANIEAMFADLHRKYEKSKALVAENKQTSELVAVELDQALAQVSREQQRYDMLQQYAEDTMHRLQSDMVLEQKSQETEALRMSARLQLAENRATKLERENQEVTAICDELIQKMGDR